jgi:hypothetical protein
MTDQTLTQNEQSWRDALRPSIQLIQRLNESEDGKALFSLMEQVFENRSLKGTDTHDTYYRLGQRDVVLYLRELRDYQQDEDR